MNGMNAEECADKQGEPPIRHAGELCSNDRSPPTRSNRQICDGLRFCSMPHARLSVRLRR
jgi:hypothetical protein